MTFFFLLGCLMLGLSAANFHFYMKHKTLFNLFAGVVVGASGIGMCVMTVARMIT